MSELSLKLTIHDGSPALWKGNVAAVGVFEEGKLQKSLSLLGEEAVKEVRKALDSGWMRGKAGETLFLPAPKGCGAVRLLLLGLGKKASLTAEGLRAAGAQLVQAAQRGGVESLLTLLPLDRLGGLGRNRVLEALVEGMALADYRFDDYKTVGKEEERRPLKFAALAAPSGRGESFRQRLERVEAVLEGVYLARNLGNHPANVVTPAYLVEVAQTLARTHNLKLTVLEEKELRQEGMGGILGVGQGSVHPPRLIVLEYHGGKGAGAPLAVVGKAVTFDTGGISLKPAAKMEEMKFDMSGGAAVLGLMKAAAGLKLSTSIVGIIPAAENMPSGTAQRPGDVIKTAKGLTVEVINTDAEGRLILADALHYAERFEPAAIVDLATLTGACVVALGSEACGLLGNDDKWVEQVRQAGERVGERAWKLPLWPGYHEMLKSPVADLRNIGDRPEAGTITGACFLSKFVGDKRKWAHLDIAGTAWDPSGRKPYAPKGAVGFGVRLLARLARDMSKKKG